MTGNADFLEFHARLPLPHGCDTARYVFDMRELMQYDISIDGYRVRHDWLMDTEKMTAMGEPILRAEIPNESVDEIEAAILVRRQAVLKARGIA